MMNSNDYTDSRCGTREAVRYGYSIAEPRRTKTIDVQQSNMTFKLNKVK